LEWFLFQINFLWFWVKIHYSGQVDRLSILLSVIPQEILYRVFFFHRYRELFPGKGLLLFASTVVFSFVHIIYLNLVAVALTLAGGYFFSKTYQETDSFLLTVIEHSIYGCFLFALGLGSAFS